MDFRIKKDSKQTQNIQNKQDVVCIVLNSIGVCTKTNANVDRKTIINRTVVVFPV